MRAVALLLLLPACSATPFPCDSDGRCVSFGVAGRCLPAGAGESFCAFFAADCPTSNLRWDPSAGPAVAGQCVFVPVPDMALGFSDDAGPPDLAMIRPCSPEDSRCEHVQVMAPFPLQRDTERDARETDSGLERDGSGFLALARAGNPPALLWFANSTDLNRGTVSKFDTTRVRELARYFTVTCNSLKTGSREACINDRGCCSLDDASRLQARILHQPQPPRQGVHTPTSSQDPYEMGMDFNGDGVVGNRGAGGQPSVTRIANDPKQCVDRNGNGRIDTSSDVNGDGLIQTDCNADGQPDDLASVKSTPCKNGLAQEFYGLDDECVLWTTNVTWPNQLAQALALTPAQDGGGMSDIWSAGGQNGAMYRVSGATGLLLDTGVLPGACSADTMAIDAGGIGWTTSRSFGPLCFFDTRNPAHTGTARGPSDVSLSAFAVSIDRDQNVWTGGYLMSDAFRYTPVRNKVFANLGTGRWVHIINAGKAAGATFSGQGLAPDSRSPSQYFVWMAEAGGHVVRLPGSELDKLVIKGTDAVYDGTQLPAVLMGGNSTFAVAITPEQNVVALSTVQGGEVARAKVDAKGTATPPDLNAAPVGNNLCPGGDRCALRQGNTFPWPVSDGDGSGFALRNFGAPQTGTYTWTQAGCGGPTLWHALSWSADLPAGTKVAARVRGGDTATPDDTWGPWSARAEASPMDLAAVLADHATSAYLQIELTLSGAGGATARLQSFTVEYHCP